MEAGFRLQRKRSVHSLILVLDVENSKDDGGSYVLPGGSEKGVAVRTCIWLLHFGNEETESSRNRPGMRYPSPGKATFRSAVSSWTAF